MISISLCMIVKNEHDTLARCLNSIKSVVDEIVIVDTGSTDDTKEIAKKFTNKVYDFTWCDDFSKARNFSFSKATKEYIMWLDADDVLLKEDVKKLKILKRILTRDVDMVLLKYNLDLDENNIPKLSFYRERIVKRTGDYKWVGAIHEVIPQKGKVIKEDIAITHKKLHVSDPDRNLRIFKKMLDEGEILDTRQLFYYARELMYHKEYLESIKTFEEFFSKSDGWKENKINACLDLYFIYSNLNKPDEALKALFKSFEYDLPRAEICCYIAKHFMTLKNFTIAKFWLELALNSTFDISSGGFYIKDCYDFIPCIELGICYYYLNDIPLAIKYNELAGSIKPNDASYINNKAFYASIVQKTNPTD